MTIDSTDCFVECKSEVASANRWVGTRVDLEAAS